MTNSGRHPGNSGVCMHVAIEQHVQYYINNLSGKVGQIVGLLSRQYPVFNCCAEGCVIFLVPLKCQQEDIFEGS